MIASTKIRAACALLGINQRRLAEASGLSLPTILRMEASYGHVQGNVGSLVKVVDAIEYPGVELIVDGVASTDGGCGVRLRHKIELAK